MADGGTKETRLNIVHMPRHRHQYVDRMMPERKDFLKNNLKVSDSNIIDMPWNLGKAGGWDNDNGAALKTDSYTTYTGNGQSFTNMPPYTTLLWIMRI